MDVWMERADSCGLYQAIHLTLTQLPRFMTVWAVFLMILAGYDPGWMCADERLDPTTRGNATAEPTQPFLGPTAASMSYYDQKENFSSNYHNKTPTKDRYDGVCETINDCSSIQFNPDSTTLVTEFQLVCDQSWVVKAILFLCGLGGLPGSFMAGYLGERYGRRLGLYTFTFLMSFFTGIAVFSPHWAMYAICSFFINFGVHGTITQANVFSMEFLNSKWRGYFGAIPIWPFSFFLFTFTVRYLRNWIYLHLVTCFFSLSSCIGFFVLPESPRWLMVHQKPEQAKDTVRKVARINRKPEPTLDFHETVQLEVTEDTGKKKPNYLDLVRTRTLRMHTIKLFVAMTLFNVCYIAISFGLQSLPGDFYTNIIVSGCCDTVILFLSSPLANKLGRRWAGISVTIVGSICCICIVLLILISGRTEYPTAIKACAFVAKSISLAVFGVCQLFVIELFPTEVRNLALGVVKSGTCLGAIFAPFLVPSPTNSSFLVSFSFSCFCFMFDLFVFVSLPETNNQNLADIIINPRTVYVVQDEKERDKNNLKTSTLGEENS